MEAAGMTILHDNCEIYEKSPIKDLTLQNDNSRRAESISTGILQMSAGLAARLPEVCTSSCEHPCSNERVGNTVNCERTLKATLLPEPQVHDEKGKRRTLPLLPMLPPEYNTGNHQGLPTPEIKWDF